MTVDIKIKEIDLFWKKKKYWTLLSSILFASDSFPTAQIHPANHFFMPPVVNSQPNIHRAESLLLLCVFLAFKGANLGNRGETCMYCLTLHSFT